LSFNLHHYEVHCFYKCPLIRVLNLNTNYQPTQISWYTKCMNTIPPIPPLPYLSKRISQSQHKTDIFHMASRFPRNQYLIYCRQKCLLLSRIPTTSVFYLGFLGAVGRHFGVPFHKKEPKGKHIKGRWCIHMSLFLGFLSDGMMEWRTAYQARKMNYLNMLGLYPDTLIIGLNNVVWC